jgi:hypothetical protein
VAKTAVRLRWGGALAPSTWEHEEEEEEGGARRKKVAEALKLA